MKGQLSLEFVMMLVFILIIFTPIAVESLSRAMTVGLISEQFEAKKLCLSLSSSLGQTLSAPSGANITTRLPPSFLGKNYEIFISPSARDISIFWRDIELSCPVPTSRIDYRLKNEEYTIVRVSPSGEDEGEYNEIIETSFGNVTINYTVGDAETIIYSDPDYLISNNTRISENIFVENIGSDSASLSVSVEGFSDYTISPVVFSLSGGETQLLQFSAEPGFWTQKGKIVLESDNSGALIIPAVIFGEDEPKSFIYPEEFELGETAPFGASGSRVIVYSETGESLKFYPEQNANTSYDFKLDRSVINIVSEERVLEIE